MTGVRESRSVNRGVRLGQRSRFLVLAKRSAASGDENGRFPELLVPTPRRLRDGKRAIGTKIFPELPQSDLKIKTNLAIE